jgi:thioredoxin 1
MSEDRELEELKRKKLQEMIERKQKEKAPVVTNLPIEVSDENFSGIVNKSGLVVVDCWASWCGPCRMIGPVIEELAKDYAGKIVFGKLNVDANQTVPTKYQIMSIPTILVFKDGKLVDRIVGAMPKKILEQRITKHL